MKPNCVLEPENYFIDQKMVHLYKEFKKVAGQKRENYNFSLYYIII